MKSWTTAELERRRPVWIALADLFLDTEVRGFLPRIALTAVEAGFSGLELWAILDREVAPLLAPNPLDVAGQWAGFNADWVCQRIEAAGPPRDNLKKKIVRGLAGFLYSDFRGPLYNLVDYLHAHPDARVEQARLTAIASLYTEKEWPRVYSLWNHLKSLSRWPARVLKESFEEGIEPSYFALLRPANGDPTEEQARQNWRWFLRLLSWPVHASDSDPILVVAAAEQLSYLFTIAHLSATPRGKMVAEKLKASGLPARTLESLLLGPLAELYRKRNIAVANWRALAL